MTDYLEELLNNTSALLEQVKRLERSWAGPVLEEAGGTEGTFSSRCGGETPETGSAAGAPEGAAAVRGSRAEPGSGLAAAPGGGGGEKDGVLPPAAARNSEGEGPERVRAPLEEGEKGSSPLLEQLERLERAAVSGAGDGVSARQAAWEKRDRVERGGGSAGWAGGASTYPNGAELPGGRWELGRGLPGPDPVPADDTLWAERADRAFRRDSRRYDGGFYLY